MNQNIESLRRHYSRLADDKLRSIVEKDVLTLTPEGLQVLKEEVAKRNLPLLRSIDDAFLRQGQINQLILDKCNNIRDLPCPICNSVEYKLNGIKLSTVVSFITLTQHKEQVHIGCYNCLMELKRKAEDKTSLLGWWGIFGIPTTLRALKSNDKAAEELLLDQPSTSLWEYATGLVQQEYASTMSEIKVATAVKDTRNNGESL